MSSVSGLNISNTDLSRAPLNSRSESGISVDGNRISWTADGWHEVQSATSYNTMSEGGTSASLPHGTYNVINHTTGERFENVQVPSSANVRVADSSTKENSLTASTSQQNRPTDIGESSGRDDALFSVTIPAGTVNNELELNNGVVVDVEEVTGEPMTDTTIEAYPEDGSDDHGFGQGMAVGGFITTFGGMAASAAGATITAGAMTVLGPVLTLVGLATAFFDFGAKPTNPQTGHNSNNDDSDLNGDGFVSGAESAENGNFGTDPEGEFGGTPTAPAPEPVSPPTTTQRPNGNDLGSSDSDSSNGGSGSVSSSQSASDGGYGTSEQGEFG